MADVEVSSEVKNGEQEVKEQSPTKSPVKADVQDKGDNNAEETTEKDTTNDKVAKVKEDHDATEDKEAAPKKEITMTPELERKIIRQIEFYFGDLNLARDRFMQEEIKNNDGWLTMETMLKFNRLKMLCDDAAKIVEAAKKSSSGLLEFSEDGSKVRRSPGKPIPSNTEERRADLKSRTCYAKNFPLTYTMSDLLDFFDQHCSTELIQMRKNAKKEFKGSVFVVFPTKEEAQKFLDIKDLKVGENVLLKMLKDEYFRTKVDLKKETKKEGSGEAADLEKAKEEKKKEAALEEADKLIRDQMVKGAILHLVGLSSDTTRDDLKAAFTPEGEEESKIAWVDHEKGDSDAWLRFNEENGAQKAWDEFSEDSKMMIKDSEVRADVLEGEVEFCHWKNIFQSRADRSSRRGRGRGRGRGGKGRRGGRDDSGPASKRPRRY